MGAIWYWFRVTLSALALVMAAVLGALSIYAMVVSAFMGDTLASFLFATLAFLCALPFVRLVTGWRRDG